MGNRGYTLLEMLVVIVILGILSGFIVLSLRGTSEQERLLEAADRLAALVRHQCEEALLNGRTVRLLLDDRGYRFEVATRGGWSASPDPVFRPRSWPVPLDADIEIDGLQPGSADAVYCLPSGEITPFELRLRSRQGNTAGVQAAPDGSVQRTGDPA
jgi:general secretion pathway protein H